MREDLSADLALAAELGGEMGRRFSSFDWASHPLGPPQDWSPGARVVVAMALTSRFPIVLWLGERLFLIYNDAYLPVLGQKHPAGLGAPGQEVWAELWDVIGPMLEGVMASGVATWSDDLMLPVVTDGRPQERYFTFTYSPIPTDAGTIEGIFCAVDETTERVLSEGRLEVLNDLAAALIDADSEDGAVEAALQVCAARPADLPFVAIYLVDPVDAERILLRGTTSPVRALVEPRYPTLASWNRPEGSGAQVVGGLTGRLPELRQLFGEAAPDDALIVPVTGALPGRVDGSLVIGINPRRPLDDKYRLFCERFADQFSAALASVRAYENERRRAESLAQLDHAKTTFLTNVSHEFRTPLTLMLAPLEDLIAEAGDEALAGRLNMVQRNARRLLRMVNSLLDFARAEAGQSEPRLEVMDVGRCTAEIVSSFAEVCQRAGIELIVEGGESVAAIDVEMWERIVLNLVSNAFKFTLAGSITVKVVTAGSGEVVLTVSDTGTGITAEDIDRLFDRFYRPVTSRGRSAEGSGIGLALVRSLVNLHGGTIQLESALGEGTTLTVRLPAVAREGVSVTGPQVGGPRVGDSYVAEALGWLGANQVADGGPRPGTGRPVVLVADDNADMRLQLQRILSAHYDVLTAADGEAALEVAHGVEPALIVTDVMMPKLDGFGLVNALRQDADLAMIPVVMLSARAGIEAAGEALLAGAEDYLIKPFRSRDLLTRVAARLDAAARTRSWHDEEVGAAGRAAIHAHLAEAVSGAMSIKDVVVAVRASPLSTLGATTASVGVIHAANDLITIEYADAIDPLFDPLFSDRYHTVAVDAPVPMAQAIRDDHTLVLTGPPDEANAHTPWAVSPGRSKGASVSVPLHANEGAVIGAFTLIWPAPRQFSADDIDIVEESARLVGRAIERLITAEREHRMATELQDRLLDLDRRATTAVISAVYQSASDALRVGGDWYTATTLDAGGLGVSVGDVVGHGLPAVAAMSQLRSASGAAALTSPEPDQVIDVIERYAQTLPGAICATLAYAVLDPTTTTLRYTCAGHPYPLVVRPDGTTAFLEGGRRPPLGTGSYASASSIGQIDLPKGSLLILYTDGLIKRRGESLDAGLARLADTAARLARAPAGEAAASLLRTMAPEDGFSDDVALVALRPAGTSLTSFVEVVPAEVAEVGPLRHRLRAWLEALGLADQAVIDVLIGVGEAVTNAMEHGSQLDPTRRVSVEIFADQSAVRASVSDTGRWRYSPELPRSPYRGRGLRLIGALAEDVVTVRAAEGTRITMTYRRAGR